ncbi:MAG: MmcQ/YjbR family DNA-binding protein [Bacteroidota bacterium]|jgi:predicted DNA-binding protein (MmcQ/YjbR family)
MTLGELLDYVLSKPETEETLPFGPDVLVLKTNGKMFLLVPLEVDPLRFNAKCDPERSVLLRAEYEGILPGYHMDKKHWNTILLDGSIPTALVRELIDHSYDLVRGLSKKSNNGK